MFSLTFCVNSGKRFSTLRKFKRESEPYINRGNVGMFATPPFAFQLADAAIGARAFSLGGCDEQVVSSHRQGAGIPVGRNETDSLVRQGKSDARFGQRRRVKNCNRIQR